MPDHTRVLVVDGDHARTPFLLEVLAAAGYEAHHASGAEAAVQHPARSTSDVVIFSLESGGLPGLTRVATSAPEAEVVVQCSSAHEAEAREGLRLGACDVITRERGTDALLFAVERAARDARRRQELAVLRARQGERAAESLVGRSAPLLALRELIGPAAASRVTLLVTGESGAGKDVVARLVHDLSDRAARPFVVVRCREVQGAALDAELFGQGATGDGLLARVRGGTLVIDEAHSLPNPLRDRLAALLADRWIDRAGARVPVDVRVILTARTSSDRTTATAVPELLGERDVLQIPVPPLRDRRSDIPLLVKHFRDRIARDTGAVLPALSPEQIAPLFEHQWPGNVRELEHWVERLVYAAAGHEAAKGAGTTPGSELAQLGTARLSLDAVERMYILHVLAQERGHQSRTAERLGIDRRTLYRKLKEYRDDDTANGRT